MSKSQSTLSETMSSIDLPAGAYHPSSDEFSDDAVTGQNSPNTVSSVEQLLRVAFALGGQHSGLELAEKAIQFQREYEEEHVFSDFVVNRDRIDASDDPWLSNELHNLADKRQEALNEEKRVYERRVHWYENDILSTLRNKVNRASSMLRDGVEFRTVRVIDEADAEVTGRDALLERNEITRQYLSGMDISKFGYDTPITLTVCISSDSGSIYPFVPWCGTTVCVGPAKHENPVSTLCKHELAALILYSKDNYDPSGPNAPERFKRLMSPQDYNRFTQNISP